MEEKFVLLAYGNQVVIALDCGTKEEMLSKLEESREACKRSSMVLGVKEMKENYSKQDLINSQSLVNRLFGELLNT